MNLFATCIYSLMRYLSNPSVKPNQVSLAHFYTGFVFLLLSFKNSLYILLNCQMCLLLI